MQRQLTFSTQVDGYDTIMVVPGTGEIGMYTLEFSNFRLMVQIETSMTVMEEGPHCDLRNWKHGYSALYNITDSVGSDGMFSLPAFGKKERQLFPKVTAAEMYAAVKKHCDESWAEHMKASTTPLDYPCNVDISRYIFILEGTLHSGPAKRMLFLMEEAMGC